jgi:pyrroline-5-carboxylate reductase
MQKTTTIKTKFVAKNPPLEGREAWGGGALGIAIIGGGNLGKSIALGLVASNFCEAKNITVTRRNVTAINDLKENGIVITDNNNTAIKNASIVLLCVKPYQIEQVIHAIKKDIKPNQIIVSVVTGVSIIDLQKMIAKKVAIFRAMPNTAIAVMQSMTCISQLNATASQKIIVENLFNKVGKTVFIEDALMDAATVLGACGTAFALRFIRAKIQGGIEIGFDSKTASLIAAQTVLGAADLLLQKNTHPEAEIDKVTTPKGCTIAGLNEMEHQGFSSSLIKGVLTSYNKIAKKLVS